MKLFTVLLLVGMIVNTLVASAQNRPNYLPGKIIMKFEADDDLARKSSQLGVHPRDQVQEIMERHGLTRFQPVFGENARNVVAQSLAKRNIDTPPETVIDDLSRTFFVDYSGRIDPMTLSSKLSGMLGVVYAEPHFVYQTTEEIPDDPLFGTPGQDFFQFQNFPQAWEISKSSSDVVIAIIDTGVFYDHPDLENKLYRIPQPSPASQAFEAIENDSIGWNFWESGNVFAGEEPVQNNDPIARWSTHGTHVAGIAAADTDNGIGITGTGYNASYMAVKVGGTQQFPRDIPFGMHGVIYAALNGADIINCSFGGEFFSHFGQDAVNLALDLNALVVASSGNTGTDIPIYPASYRGALSVGSVDIPANETLPGRRSNYSTYGINLDVFATGRSIRSTGFEYHPILDTWTVTPDSLGYIFSTGTSMSAPVVSGLAALIKHQNPDWSPQRIAYQIRNTSRLMYDDHGSQFDLQLGRGIIDAYAALTEEMPGLKILSVDFLNEDGESLNIGETGVAEITLINYGASANPSISITPLTDNITVLDNNVNLGNIDTDEIRVIELGIILDDDYNLEDIPRFNIEFSDPDRNYDDFSVQKYEDLLFEIVSTDVLAMSFSNDGTIGFRNPIDQDGGIGFIPGELENQLYEGGLMIYAEIDDSTFIPNQVRFEDEVERNFSPVQNIRSRAPELADIEVQATFNSSRHPVADDLHVEMNVFAFDEEMINQMVFVRYRVTNTSNIPYNNVHIGLFNDWDVGDYITNSVGFSESDSLIFAFDNDNPGNPYVAVAHMGAISSAFAIDNTSPMTLQQAETRQDSLNFGIYYSEQDFTMDGFTREEKKLSMTAGFEQTLMGNTDVSIVTATGPFNLLRGGSVTVGFIYAYGMSLEELQLVVAAGRERELFHVSEPGSYRDGELPGILPEETRLYQNYPNPFNDVTQIQYDLAEPGGFVELEVYNILGQRVATLVNEHQTQGRRIVPFSTQNLASGVYLAVLRVDGRQHTMKMSLVR